MGVAEKSWTKMGEIEIRENLVRVCVEEELKLNPVNEDLGRRQGRHSLNSQKMGVCARAGARAPIFCEFSGWRPWGLTHGRHPKETDQHGRADVRRYRKAGMTAAAASEKAARGSSNNGSSGNSDTGIGGQRHQQERRKTAAG